jgi:hypothetical protein
MIVDILMATLLAADPAPATPVEPAAPETILAGVNAADGIDYMEAFRIAQGYFAIHVGCGGFSGISDGGGVWVVHGQFGIAGTPIQGFSISKLTGAISSPVGPSYARPADMTMTGR